MSDFITGYKWTLVLTWTQRILGLISTAVLVKILSPTDFGIQFASLVVIMFFRAISNSGITEIILKRREITPDEISQLRLLQIIYSFISSGLIYELSDNIAIYLEKPALEEVLKITCLMPIITSFLNPSVILYQKSFDFKRVALVYSAIKLICIPITVALSFYFHNYWALIYSEIIQSLLTIISSYVFFKSNSKFFIPSTLSIFSESFKFTLSALIGYAKSRVESIFILKYFSVHDIGIYNIGREISNLPFTEVIGPAYNPLLASVSRCNTDIFHELFRFVFFGFLLISPSTLFIQACADGVVASFLGEKWIELGSVMFFASFLMIGEFIFLVTRILYISADKVIFLSLGDIVSVIATSSFFLFWPTGELFQFIIFKSVTTTLIAFSALTHITKPKTILLALGNSFESILIISILSAFSHALGNVINIALDIPNSFPESILIFCTLLLIAFMRRKNISRHFFVTMIIEKLFSARNK